MTKEKLISDLVMNMQAMRLASNMSQTKLGEELKKCRQTITNIERGALVPSVEMILEWAEACGHEVDITFKAK